MNISLCGKYSPALNGLNNLDLYFISVSSDSPGIDVYVKFIYNFMFNSLNKLQSALINNFRHNKRRRIELELSPSCCMVTEHSSEQFQGYEESK